MNTKISVLHETMNAIENKDKTSIKKNKSFPKTINELVRKMNENNKKYFENINEQIRFSMNQCTHTCILKKEITSK